MANDMNGIIMSAGDTWRFNRKMAYTKLFTKEKVRFMNKAWAHL